MIHYHCKVLYGNVYLHSYVYLLFNVIIFNIIKYLFEEILVPYVQRRFIGKVESELQPADLENASGIKVELPDHSTETRNPMITSELSQPPLSDSPVMNTSTSVTELKSSQPPLRDSPVVNTSTSTELKSSQPPLRDSPVVVDLATSTEPVIKLEVLSLGEIYFMRFQCLMAWLAIITGFINIDSSNSSWNQYQDFYGFLLNSATITYLISFYLLLIRKPGKEEDSKEIWDAILYQLGNKLFVSWVFFLFFLLPAFITHILPALFMYLWIVIILLLILFIITVYLLDFLIAHGNYCFGSSQTKEDIIERFGIKIAVKIGFRLFFLLIIQTGFNYAYFLYQNDLPNTGEIYLHVIRTEYDYRTQTRCNILHAIDSFENSMVFFSFL